MTDRYTSRATTHADGCWSWGHAHYECAVREIERLQAEVDRLREALREARDAIEDWAGYASDYFREKHDLAGDLAKIDAALAKENSND